MRRALAAIVATLALVAPATASAAPPVVTFTAQPPAVGNQRAVSFTFGANDAAATFTCSLDAATPVACTSPHSLAGLPDGPHTFTVVATNATMESANAVSNFSIDTVAASPVVEQPTAGVLVTASPITFRGHADPGGVVTITEVGQSPVSAPVAPDGSWSAAVAVRTDATHAYTFTATDVLGNVSQPASWSAPVDVNPPNAPVIDSPVDGAAQRSTTVVLSGRTEAKANVTVLEGSVSRGSTNADAAGNWTLSVPGVSQGKHSYIATATDAANHTSAASAPQTVTVALNAPSPPVISGGPDAFSIVSPDAGTTLDCRLDTPAGQGPYGPCPLSYPGLGPGDYTLVARATDAAGNESTASRPFTVGGAAQSVTPEPAGLVVAPMPKATAAAVPVFGQKVVLRPSSGRTLIRRPGATGFEELRAKTAVPLGTVVDVKNGIVVLTAAPAAGAQPESAKFFGGVFTVTQQSGATQLTLSETLRCGRTRKLWGDGSGSFRIRGRYGSATGRGAKWLVEDSCKSTDVRVSRGVVAVRGDRSPKTVLVRAGRQYVAQR